MSWLTPAKPWLVRRSPTESADIESLFGKPLEIVFRDWPRDNILRHVLYGGIYRVECVPTGECYIGQSRDLRSRLAGHLSVLRMKTHQSHLMIQRFLEHGSVAFIFHPCVLMTESEFADMGSGDMGDLECEWIRRFNPVFNTQSTEASKRRRKQP